MTIRRRDLLTGTAVALVGGTLAQADVVTGKLPWHPDAGEPPQPVEPGGWKFFTPAEVAAVEALVDRIIPPDPQTPGGKDAGCAVFIDRQLAGPYGRAEGLYDRPPFLKGSKTQGPQSAQTPAQTYRAALAALDHYCRVDSGRRQPFAQLDAAQQDEILQGTREAAVRSSRASTARPSSSTCCKDVQEGFFADPDLRRQPRHVRVEDDRLPRRALRLSRLGRPAQRALPASAGEHRRPTRTGRRTLSGKRAMARKLPHKDVVIIGLGWTGSILANELTDAGLDVIAIERGPWRNTATDYPPDLCAGRAALSHPSRAVPAARRRRPSPSATR